MKKESFKTVLIRLGIYLVTSALLTWLLIASKGFFNNIFFWIYIGVMGVSAIIAKWYGNADDNPKWVLFLRHVAFVCFISLLMFWVAITYILD
ncbi:MAG: hypothetical protein DWQ02_09360 [Bacteroidetes bacterium]|nr:MAG: hypothetical protein DWQ02_09360 [Bacteroidota bacterium]